MTEEARAQVGVVTGGTGALGRWVVKALVEEGMRVHVPWRSGEEAGEVTRLVGGPRSELSMAEADVTDPAAMEGYLAGVVEKEGRLDALCALVGGFAAAPLEETGPELWERMIRVNATSAWVCCRAAVPHLRRSGGGRIVTVASWAALGGGAPGMSAYAAAKAAVVSLTSSLSEELRPLGIAVNAVAPEILDTPANRDAMPGADRSRWLHPADAARVVAFLLGPAGGCVTGSVLRLAAP